MAAVYSQLTLPSRFGAGPWFVSASSPAPTALDSLPAFGNAFPYAAAVSALLILLLAIAQSRRILRPLRRLIVGTRNIAAREFATRVHLDGGDEFQELGLAMNAMAQQLGRQFSTRSWPASRRRCRGAT
jgi:HAMP domain-containing protein